MDPEIAETMECTEGIFKYHLARARDLMRQACSARGLDWQSDEN